MVKVDKANNKSNKDTYWESFMGVPLYKVDWYFKFFLYKIFRFTFGKSKDQRLYWNTRGKTYFDDFFATDYYKYETFFQDLLVAELKNLQFSSIFEAGCGFGWNIKRIKQEMPSVRVGGLDFSFPQLENRKRYAENIIMPAAQGTALCMPFKDKAFDIGFTMGVYMNIHPKNIDKAINELLRVTRKYIIHLEWDQNNTNPQLQERRIFKTNIVSHDYRRLYSERGKEIIKFSTYRDFGNKFYERFPITKIKLWEEFEGPGKYILIIAKL